MKLLKKIYNRLLSKHQSRGNKAIHVGGVSPEALKGRNIEILSGVYVSEDCSIGSYTFIGFNSLISKSIIGNYCSIASNVNIGHGEHPIDHISTSGHFLSNSYNVLTNKDCIIEHDVWIGVGSIIRRGVTVGTGAIVGANSFVNKDVPPFAVVAGSPAKIIRYRFDEKKINKILASRWWELDIEEAKEVFIKIND